MTRRFLSLGALVCLAFVAACNAKVAEVGGDEGGDGGVEPWADGVPEPDAAPGPDPTADASPEFDGGIVYDATPGDDGSVTLDAGCPPPPPPCGCPVADASVPEDAEAPAP